MRLRLLWFISLWIALSCAQDATVVSGDAAAATIEGLTDGADTTSANSNSTTAATEDKPRFPRPDEMLAQVPPITVPRSGIPTVDAFYSMFPALSSVLRWSSLFPAQSILGAVPDTLQTPSAAASKVVLVLADDATNGQKSRVTRQNPPPAPAAGAGPAPSMFQQLLSQMPPMPQAPNLGQMMVGQSWLPEGLVGQMPPLPAMDQFNLGQTMSSFGLPALDGLLGAPAPVPAPAPAPAAKSASEEAPAPAPAPVPAPNPPATPLNFAGFFDGTNNMLGSALSGSLPPAATPDAFMAGLRQFFPGGAAPLAQAASDISEVRVKPETQRQQKRGIDVISYRNPQQAEAQLAQLKIKSALQAEQEQQKSRRIRSLRAFERQVITELKLLQQIEGLAREMRANEMGTSGYKLRYPLSRTPVHKITRADIERALRDDYVRRLLHKEAQRKTQRELRVGRQATSMMAPQTAETPMSKEDIINVMAYAYRMASNSDSDQLNQPKQDKIYAAYRADNAQQTLGQMMRTEDQAKVSQGTSMKKEAIPQ
ncbi:hypothetical protein ACLKA6_019586, partial [Drosophila palustris]